MGLVWIRLELLGVLVLEPRHGGMDTSPSDWHRDTRIGLARSKGVS